MKKLLYSLIVLLAGTMGCMAQSAFVATLSHGSNLTTYSGADALSQAYTAAVAGDVITLSSGTFNAVNIEKAITVRGAGMYGSSNNVGPTTISGEMTINIPDGSAYVPTLEGLFCPQSVEIKGSNLAPANIVKCRFENYVGCIESSPTFINCKNINEGSYLYTIGATVHCINCVLRSPQSQSNPKSSIINLENCVVLDGLKDLYNSNLKNCILITRSGSLLDLLPSSSSANYCVAYDVASQSQSTFSAVAGGNNRYAESMESLFKTLRNFYTDSAETFELTTTAASTYLGDDGKQVGIYGGTNPYNATPTNPQITTFTVESNVNNNKLSVTINVE